MAITLAGINALTADAGSATGYIDFGVLPEADDTITINGVVFTFKASSGGATEITIGANVTAAAANAAAILNASVNTSVDDATYSSSAGRLTVTHDTPGEAGLAFTLARSASARATASGATLSASAGSTNFAAIPAAVVGSDYEKALASLIPLVASLIRLTTSPAADPITARRQRNQLKRILTWASTNIAAATNNVSDDRSAVADRFVAEMSMRLGRATKAANAL